MLHLDVGGGGDLSGGFLRGGQACSFLSSEFNDMLILTRRSTDRSERVRLCSAHAVTAAAASVARAVRWGPLSGRSESSGRADTLLVLRSIRVVGGRAGTRRLWCWGEGCGMLDWSVVIHFD